MQRDCLHLDPNLCMFNRTLSLPQSNPFTYPEIKSVAQQKADKLQPNH